MILTPHLDIGSIRKYYPNLSTEQKSIINERANSIIGYMDHPQLIQVNQYKGVYSTDEKDSKVVFPLSIHGQLGSNKGLSEGVIPSGLYEGQKLKRVNREQGIIALCYELDKNLGGNDRIRSLFLHNMETIEELSIEEQFKILEENSINNIEELSKYIRNSINYKPIASNNTYYLFAESKIFKKIP